MFNTVSGNIRIFNKDSGLSRNEFFKKYSIPNCLYFDLIKWINSNKMTKEEKAEHPEYKTTGGYLKTLEYKEAAKESISKASEKEKAQIRALPNYDPDVFEAIFGIRI
jgi:hypothetical protein